MIQESTNDQVNEFSQIRFNGFSAFNFEVHLITYLMYDL